MAIDAGFETGQGKAAADAAGEMTERVKKAQAGPAQPRHDFSPYQHSLAERGLLIEGIQPDRTSVELRMPDGTVETHEAQPIFISGNTLMAPTDLGAVGRTIPKGSWNI